MAFWRRDLRSVLRNSASTPDNDFDKDFPVARSLASWASDASGRVLDPFTALRSRAFKVSFPALAPSRAMRNQKISSDSDRTLSD